MTASELKAALARRFPDFPASVINHAVNGIFSHVIETLSSGGYCEFRAFGSFLTKERSARKGRNPRNGVAVEVADKRFPAFRCGRILLSQVNEWEYQKKGKETKK